MDRRALCCFSILGIGALVWLCATAAHSEDNVVDAGVAEPAPPVARGYIAAAPVASAPYMGYPSTSYAPTCCTSVPCPASYPALARVDDQGRLLVQQSFVNPVTEMQTEQAEAVRLDGQKVNVASPVVKVRYVVGLQERPFEAPYDVYRIDGTKLSEEEGRKILKEERGVVVAGGAAQMAEVMSALGRKLYRDDALVIVIKNNAPPLGALAPVFVPGGTRPAASPVTAPPVLPSSKPVLTPVPPKWQPLNAQ